jgi:hypothetical protein
MNGQNLKRLTKVLQLKSKFKDFQISHGNPGKAMQQKLALQEPPSFSDTHEQSLIRGQHQDHPRFELKAYYQPVAGSLPFSELIVQDLLTRVEKITATEKHELPETVVDSAGNTIQLDLIFYNNLLNYYSKQNGNDCSFKKRESAC